MTEEQARSALFDKLYMNMEEGVVLHTVIFDDNGEPSDYVIDEVNPAFERIMSIKREDARGKPASVLYQTGTPPYLEEFSSVLKGPPTKTIEVDFKPRNAIYQVSICKTHEKGFATIFSDVTVEKKRVNTIADLNQKLEEERSLSKQARRVKDDFVTCMTHDLRTPISVIVASLEVLGTIHGTRDSPAAPWLDIILRSCQSLETMIEDIMAASQVDKDRIVLSEAPFSPSKLMRNVGGQYTNVARSRRIGLEIEEYGDLPDVMGDILRVRQIVSNILSNALKYSTKGGMVTVKVEMEKCDPPPGEHGDLKMEHSGSASTDASAADGAGEGQGQGGGSGAVRRRVRRLTRESVFESSKTASANGSSHSGDLDQLGLSPNPPTHLQLPVSTHHTHSQLASMKPLQWYKLQVTVKDEGIGIPEHLLPIIWDRFSKSSIHDSNRGVGMGLYLVKKFAEMMDGGASVTSVFGEGSEFNVWMLLAGVPTLPTVPEVADEDGVGGMSMGVGRGVGMTPSASASPDTGPGAGSGLLSSAKGRSMSVGGGSFVGMSDADVARLNLGFPPTSPIQPVVEQGVGIGLGPSPGLGPGSGLGAGAGAAYGGRPSSVPVPLEFEVGPFAGPGGLEGIGIDTQPLPHPIQLTVSHTHNIKTVVLSRRGVKDSHRRRNVGAGSGSGGAGRFGGESGRESAGKGDDDDEGDDSSGSRSPSPNPSDDGDMGGLEMDRARNREAVRQNLGVDTILAGVSRAGSVPGSGHASSSVSQAGSESVSGLVGLTAPMSMECSPTPGIVNLRSMHVPHVYLGGVVPDGDAPDGSIGPGQIHTHTDGITHSHSYAHPAHSTDTRSAADDVRGGAAGGPFAGTAGVAGGGEDTETAAANDRMDYDDNGAASGADDGAMLEMGKKILLVEDNEHLIFAYAMHLRAMGHIVDTAVNGKIAVQTFRRAPCCTYTMILMDLHMPVMDGFTAVEHIRRHEANTAGHTGHKPVHIIAVTAHSLDTTAPRLIKAGFDSFVGKPLRQEMLHRLGGTLKGDPILLRSSSSYASSMSGSASITTGAGSGSGGKHRLQPSPGAGTGAGIGVGTGAGIGAGTQDAPRGAVAAAEPKPKRQKPSRPRKST